MIKEKLGYSCSIHGFGAEGENYPLTKAMIDHNHDRVQMIDWREVSDEVDREILEGVRAFEGKGSDGWDHRIGEDLVHLAHCTAGNIFPDISGKAGPPVIFGKEDDGVKMTTMATFKGAVGGSDQIMAGQFGNVKASLVIESPVIESPVLSS